MAVIDDKVVAMSFESSKFESGVNKTITALEKLKSALKFDNAGKGLEDINKAAQNVQLGHIGRAVDDIKGKFSALSVAALAVIANIAQKAVSAGANFVKAFTLDPIKAGFHEYATNLNAVQTILANTQASGAKLKDVNNALNTLNAYSDRTIYNFSQMAKNIGTFTAAGVDLKTSTEAIKGIANLAALSGSNAEQASTAMYQLSQAISAGRVSLQDWNSVVNAGMGGTVFQRALAQTAEAMGTLKDGTVKLTGPMKNVSIAGESFRQSLQAGPGKKSWLTSDVLTTTLKQFTGDLSNAQLKAQGFNDAQIKAIQATAKTAQKAATEVKTLSQVLDVARETAGSGWAKTWQIIFGNFGEAKTLFTGVSNAVNGFINASANARNKVLGDWKELGGRTVLINAIKTAFQNLGAILKPIKEAFRDIFPATTGRDLNKLTWEFKAFAEALKPSPETVENLKRTFRGLFAVLDIGKQIIGGIFTVFGRLFGVISDGSGSFLQITARIGDFLVSVDESLKKGDRLNKFFEGLGTILAAPLRLLGSLADAIANLFGGFSSGGFSQQMGGITKAMTPFQRVMAGVVTVWNNFLDSVSNTGKILQPAMDAIVQLVQGLGPAIGNAVSGMNFEAILQVIRTGLFAGLVLLFKNFFGKGSLLEQVSKGFGGGILENIAGSFKALQGSMVAMQQNIKADTLQKIAIAIGILTASIVALSFVDPKRLNSALIGIGVAFGELLGAMAILDKIGKSGGFIKIPFIAGSLIFLAGAIDILAIAVMALSRLSWEELLKGLGGVGFLLAAISAATIPLSANSAGMIRAGIGITAIAIALKILASAIADFGGMSWTEIGKGLSSVAIGLGIMSAAARAMPTGMVAQGAGLIAIAVGLKILADAVSEFGGMDWRVIGKGMAGIGGGLIVIAAAMHLMPKNMVITAAGLLLVSVALGKIADVVQDFGGMSIKQIAKGLGTLAGSLVILAAALYAMSGTLAGAAALAIAAAGLALLAPALTSLGKQSWEQILKGLITLAAALTILGIAGIVLTPVVPVLLGLGAALLLLGAGLALAGAGIALIGIGLSAIAVAGPTAIGILVQALIDLSEAVPKMVKNLVLGLLEIVKELSKVAPQFVDALIKILNSLVDVVIQAAPKIGEAFTVLLNTALKVLQDNQGKIIQAGFNLIIALLQGIKNNIPQLITLIIDIIAKILSTIANNLGKIITAGSSILINLLKGIADHIADVATTVGTIITRFLNTIASNLGKIATAGLSILTKFLGAISDHIGEVITTGTDIIVKFIKGIGNAEQRVVTAAVETMTKFINQIAKSALKLADEAAKAILIFLNGVAAAIDTYAPQFRSAGMRIGIAIADGVTFGLASKAASVAKSAWDIGIGALNSMKHAVGSKSPSKEAYEIGGYIVQGFANGLSENGSLSNNAAKDLGNGVIKTFNNVFQTASPSKVMYEIGKFVGQGFAQGLRGSGDDIRSAFADLNEKLTDSMRTARETIATEQDKLNKLREANKPDAEAIKEAQKTIDENQSILERSIAGHNTLVKTLRDERRELLDLAGDYEKIGEKLKDAQGVLADAIATRDEAVKDFTNKYSTLPDIVTEDAEGHSVDQLANYMEALKREADAVAAYHLTLEQLRKLGLDDATLQKLIDEGTMDQAFADQLLAGGRTAVEALNVLDANLMTASKSLATDTATELYQAGVDAAQGLVDGLRSKKHSLRRAMEDLAGEMLDALRKSLKIKSPSEEFAEIGRFAMEGLAQGFSDSSKMVTDAVDDATKNALTAMRKSMSELSDVVTEEIDSNPVITPVLDLTQIRNQSQELAALTNVVPITAATSFRQASTISSAQTAAQVDQTTVAPGGTSVKFEQNNYSPESLSEVEIYRQTKNQLSQLKSVLALT
jgi:tape measure domain-containing protein